jgi:membrane protein required for colicin V production
LLGWLNKLGGILLYTLLYGMIFSVFLFYCKEESGAGCLEWAH